MEKKTVNYIKTIAEMRSISAAAESLGISQPALSAHLKKTEAEVGAVLFDRSRQPLELTEAGQAYLNYLDRTQSLEKELEQTIADIEGLETGSLTIGGAVFFNIAYIPRAVGAFAKEYPGVKIEIVDGNVPFLATEALKGRLDLFITPDADEPDRFVYEELLKERVFLAVPSDWDINKSFTSIGSAGETVVDKSITKDEFKKLCDCPFILLREDQNIGKMMEQLFEKYNCRPKKTIHVEQTMTSLALTMAGVGVSLITENSIRTSGLAKLPELYLADETICNRLKDALANVVYEAVLTPDISLYQDRLAEFGLDDPELIASAEFADGTGITLRLASLWNSATAASRKDLASSSSATRALITWLLFLQFNFSVPSPCLLKRTRQPVASLRSHQKQKLCCTSVPGIFLNLKASWVFRTWTSKLSLILHWGKS